MFERGKVCVMQGPVQSFAAVSEVFQESVTVVNVFNMLVKRRGRDHH